MITLQQLQVFCTVAEHLNYTRAAEALSFTQPTVTFHIRMLERELDLQLCEVHGHRIFLTPAGEFFQQRAAELIDAVDSMRRSMREFRDIQTGLLKLGATPTVGTYVAPSILSRFRAKYPRIHLSMDIRDTTTQVEQRLLTRAADIGLVAGQVTNPAVEAVEFQTDELVVAVPAGHPLSGQTEVEVEQLAGEPFLINEEGSASRTQALDALKTLAGKLNVVLELNGAEAMKRAVLAGVGIALISRIIVQEEIEQGRIAELHLKGHHLHRSLSVIYLRERVQSPAARAFIDSI